MTKVGIVGHEGSKFSMIGEATAIELIYDIVDSGIKEVVSGGCHLGGIDLWAAQIGRGSGLKVTEFIPRKLNWSEGYKPRNLQIALYSDVVHVIVVDKLPSSYTGMRFEGCYHCKTDNHVKSGGCWTGIQAQKLGKKVYWDIIKNL